MRTFEGKKMTEIFPGGKVTTDFRSAKIEITSGNCTKSIPLGEMTLKDYEQLILKTELENTPVSELTVKEFNVLNFLTLQHN